MGHVLNYTLGDVVTHFQRRHGKHVLRPMGWDSFGLPAENAAIREGGHPREITERNIVNIERQMHRLGWAIDWDRVIAAHDPAYYRWTQWLFLRFLERGLAYRKEAPVNWCPNDQTVLANEQVVNGHCDRCGAAVEVRKMEQWFFRITAYADALLRRPRADRLARADEDDPAQLDRPLRGRRAAVPDRRAGRRRAGLHDAAGHGVRRDLLRAGARAPAGRHDGRALAERRRAARVRRARRWSSAPRSARRPRRRPASSPASTRRTRRPTARIPVWVADYVLMEYGTGAIMAVPGHDERDREFAERFELPIVEVIDEEAGMLVDSAQFSGMPVEEAKRAIVEWLGRARPRPAGGQLPPARLGLLAPALLGLPDPGRLLRRLRDRPRAGRRAARAAARGRGLPAEGQAAAGLQRGVAERPVPVVRRPGPARGRDDGHVRRLGLVLPALLRPAQRPRAVLARAGRLLGAGRPVHRRDRPRDRAPALLALLRQGAERAGDGRLPRAVPAAVPPGLGAPGRDEDVEVAAAT